MKYNELTGKIIPVLKKPQVWGFFLSLAVIVAISLAFFAPDNFEGNTLSQPDMIQGAANGQEGVAFQQQTGEKALWTNSLFSGMPTFQISPSYPSNSLFTWLNSLYGMWLPSPSNLLCMMMLGFLILLYCLGTRWYYALIGAVAWGLSTYFVIIIGAGHIWKFVTLSYIPPTIGGIVLCYRRRYVLGGALTSLFGMLQLNANHPQMSYYFAFVIAGFAIAYLVSACRDKSVRGWFAATGVVAGAMLLAAGANLPSLYNSYEYAKETQRAPSELTIAADSQVAPAERPTGGMPRAQIVGWSYGGSEMFSLLVPNIKGGASDKPVAGQMQPLTLSQLDSAADVTNYKDRQLLQCFSQYFNDSEGTNGPVYVGALICALFLLGCLIVRGPMKWALLALTIFSVLVALGRNFEGLTDFMIYNVPMFSKFRTIESILVIAEFTMPLLAVLALAKFISGDKVDREKKGIGLDIALYICFGVCGIICLVAWLAPGVFGDAITSQDSDKFNQIWQEFQYPTAGLEATITAMRHAMVSADALRSLVFLFIGFIALYAYRRGWMLRGYAIAIVGMAVLIDLYGADKRYVSHDSFVPAGAVSPYQTTFTPDAIDRAILADTTASYRVMDFTRGFSVARRSYFHKMIGGYHSAKLRRYNDLITTGAIGMPQVLDMLNARYIITGEADCPVVPNPGALGNAWLVDDLRYVASADEEFAALDNLDPAHQAVADRSFLEVLGNDVVAPQPGDTVYMTYYSPNTLKYHVRTTDGGLAVFSEIYFPWGWKAEIDGTPAPLGRVNYVLRALRIPAGSHEITMTFDPDSIHTTSAVAYACVTLIYLWLIAGLFTAWMRRKDGIHQ